MIPDDRRGGRDDLGDDDAFPVDPDIALITDYLARELAPSAAAEVEHRLRTDFAFYEKVAPIVKVWRMKARFGPRFGLTDAPAESAPAPAAAPPPRRVREPEPAYQPFVERTGIDFPVSPELAMLTERRLRWAARRRIAVNAFAVVSLVGLVATGPFAWWIQHVASQQNAIDIAAGRAPSGYLRAPNRVDVPPSTPQVIVLPHGSRVVVNEDGHYNWKATIPPATAVSGTLDGRATFDITREERTVEVRTSVGRVLLTPGSYAVQCEPGCTAMLVSVGIGMAGMRGDSSKTIVQLQDGEHGHVRRGAPPEKVSPEASYGYPSPPKTSPKVTGGAPR